MGYRNKTYVCFDGDEDIKWYRLMTAWNENKNFDINFYDAHNVNKISDANLSPTIKKKLRERMGNAKILIVLIGEKTKNLYEYVRYEIKLAIEMEIPIISVNLNGKKNMDNKLCPKIIKDNLAIHIPYGAKIMKFALENWPTSYNQLKKDEKNGPYHYNETVYQKLSIK